MLILMYRHPTKFLYFYFWKARIFFYFPTQWFNERFWKISHALKIFDYGDIEIVSGNRIKQTILLKQGIKQEIAKKISKNIRDQIKKINVSINGETLRVASKSKNDLQLAIKLVSELEESLNIPLKANNFR